MVALGYMEHGRGLYRLGPKAFRLAADILAIRRFPNLVRPILQELAAKSGETVFLVVLDRAAQRMTYADIIDSAEPGALHGPDRHDAAALRLGRRPDAAGLSGPGLGRFLYPHRPGSSR